MSEMEKGIDWLYSLGKFGIKLGLSNTRELLKMAGNPHEGVKGVHIAGTNGKGSVAAMLTSMLVKAGYRVGTYTSPHLLDFRERIAIDGKPISEKELTVLIHDFRDKVQELNARGVYPTFFEVTTSMAFRYFADSEADVWVVETGMGGRLDSTNVTGFRTGVITSIGMDHVAHLGADLESIAREKAGIIKDSMNVSTAAEGNILNVLRNKAQKHDARIFSWKRDFSADVMSIDISGTEMIVHGIHDDYHVRTALPGRHQALNAALAISAAELMHYDGIYVEKSAVIAGVKGARWSGRFELVNRDPDVIMDAAHNLPGAMALAQTLMDVGLWGKYTLVLGILNDKDADGISSTLASGASRVIITQPEYTDRAMKMEELLEITKKYAPALGIRDPEEAVETAMESGNPVVVAGSIYLLGDVLSSVKFNNKIDMKFD